MAVSYTSVAGTCFTVIYKNDGEEFEFREEDRLKRATDLVVWDEAHRFLGRYDLVADKSDGKFTYQVGEWWFAAWGLDGLGVVAPRHPAERTLYELARRRPSLIQPLIGGSAFVVTLPDGWTDDQPRRGKGKAVSVATLPETDVAREKHMDDPTLLEGGTASKSAEDTQEVGGGASTSVPRKKKRRSAGGGGIGSSSAKRCSPVENQREPPKESNDTTSPPEGAGWASKVLVVGAVVPLYAQVGDRLGTATVDRNGNIVEVAVAETLADGGEAKREAVLFPRSPLHPAEAPMERKRPAVKKVVLSRPMPTLASWRRSYRSSCLHRGSVLTSR